MLKLEELPTLYASWRQRHAERDLRHGVIDSVVSGDFSVFDPDEEKIENRSPNLVQVALEDTAEAASIVPTVRVRPTRMGERAKKIAAEMEEIAAAYLGANEIDLLIPRTVMDLAAYGMAAWTITPDFQEKRPLIERRDPRHCYPEPGHRPGDTVRKVMFARNVYLSQLPNEYQTKIYDFINDNENISDDNDPNKEVVLVEWYDDQEIVVAAIYGTAANTFAGQEVVYWPVELDRVEHDIGVCPVVVEGRITLDGEFRGQFDQVVGMLEAHIRLTGLILDYADQAVYSDIWVRDLIGEMPFGGGAYIELGPNGAIGRVPPAVSSLNVQADLAQLVDSIHVGGRWPKSRPGEIDQSIASAKYLEASAGMMNTAIRTYHMLLQRHMSKALRVALMVDKRKFGGGKSVAHGVLRNQQFLMEYDPGDIDLTADVQVEYGLGLGRDPAQSAVLHIQYGQSGYISEEFIRENIEGLSDATRELARIDVEKLRAMALAKLLQGLEQGTVPNTALVQIARAREDGDSLFDLFEEFVAQPEEEMMANAVPTGLGPPSPPGGPAGGPGAGPAAPIPPPAPAGADLLARMNVPAGPGGTLGTQVMEGAGG